MPRKVIYTVCSLVLFKACLPVGEGDETPLLTVEQFRIADNERAGWVQSPYENSFCIVDNDSLFYTVINGGAQVYIEHGYRKALRQEMEGPEDQKMVFMVTDFGSAEKAASFFRLKSTTPDTADLKIPGYDSTTALGYANPGGITVFIWHENLYIDLALAGFYGEEPMPEIARSFIDLLFKKAGITAAAVKT
ncbi:MAG: hypothetical protein JXA18_03570 [Chitinispirillaceae bacterium]|nr:hypothetical protein [Chitinispirillaceae bacterium]